MPVRRVWTSIQRQKPAAQARVRAHTGEQQTPQAAGWLFAMQSMTCIRVMLCMGTYPWHMQSQSAACYVRQEDAAVVAVCARGSQLQCSLMHMRASARQSST